LKAFIFLIQSILFFHNKFNPLCYWVRKFTSSKQVPTGPNWFQRVPTGANGFQQVPTCPNGFQQVSTCPNGF